ncbi:MAG TPA: nuclear transport factor 2 family protein [Allosphingosinicella sp.]|jgi:ketosteroid isomerase-like protein
MTIRLLALAGAAILASPAHARRGDEAAIRAAIEAGARACEAGRPHDVVASYDRGIILSYPGIADQDYDAIAAGYRQLCRGSGEGTVQTTRAAFDEVIVSGDLAVVRIVWTTHLRGMPEGAYRRLKDMQVWRRQAGGWRFVRGVHYPLRP